MCVSKIFCFRKKEFVTSVTCFSPNEYWDNLNVHLLLRNTLYKWIHNVSAVPELTGAATPLSPTLLFPLHNIAPFWPNLPLSSLLLLRTCRVSPSICSLDTALPLRQIVTRDFTHTLLFLSLAGVAQCGLEGLVFETRMGRNVPHSGPALRPSMPPV